MIQNESLPHPKWKQADWSELNRPAALLARVLLGYYVVHLSADGPTVGKIVETEAYLGSEDPAAHSYRGQTNRTRAMFGPAGHAYIYFSYGIHYCLNVTAGRIGKGEGVLIRALEPIEGLDLMRRRRKRGSKVNHAQELSIAEIRDLANGPGKLVQAMGIGKHLYGHNLTTPPLYLSPGSVGDSEVITGPRIGITKAVDLPLRYWINHNSFVSKNGTNPSQNKKV